MAKYRFDVVIFGTDPTGLQSAIHAARDNVSVKDPCENSAAYILIASVCKVGNGDNATISERIFHGELPLQKP